MAEPFRMYNYASLVAPKLTSSLQWRLHVSKTVHVVAFGHSPPLGPV